MGPKKRFGKSSVQNVAKARAARASQSNNGRGRLCISSHASELCQRLPSQHLMLNTFSTFCPVVSQLVVLCKPFSTCFRPVFRPPCLLRRRYWLTFALVCSSGCKEVEASASESAPTPNVQQNGEKLKLIRGKCGLGFQVHQQPRYASSLITFQ